MTPIGLIQDGDESAYRQEVKELAVWCSLNNLELNRSKQWRWSWTSGDTPPLSPHSPSWRALWLQWSHSDSWAPHHFLRTWSGSNHIDSIVKKAQQRRYFLRQLRTQLYSEAALLCHHWIHPLHVNNCLVKLSFQIWPQKTTEGSPDCWANH